MDQGLERLTAFWAGEFEPAPVQQPRIPIWVAGRWPNRRPVKRAVRWDGFFPIDLPESSALGELVEDVRGLRGGTDDFDVVVEISPGDDVDPWDAAGATWVLTAFESSPVGRRSWFPRPA